MRKIAIFAFAAGLLLSSGCPQEGEPEEAQARIEALADEIVRHTPEHVHYAEGTAFSWVFVELQEPQPIPGLSEAVLKRLRERYTVYRSEEEIPEDRLSRAPDRTLLGYQDGFRFKFEVEVLGPDRVKVRYEDWEGNMAGSGQTITYEWNGSAWEIVEKGPLFVS